MKEFKYTIKDPVGIHARPAGILVKEVQALTDVKVFIAKGAKKVEANRLFSLMSLGVKCGDEIVVSVEGANEDNALAKLEEFFKNNL